MNTPRNTAGSMTRAMTAVRAANTPRVLRVAVIENGHVREERILRDDNEVTVGTDPRCTFTVPADADLPRTVLFARRGASWSLSLTRSVEGRVQRDGAVVTLSDLRARGEHALSLDESSRGRITVAGLTLLFQFVAAPPAVKSALPAMLVRRPLRELDWGYNACVAGFCALAFAGMGYLEFGYDPIAESLDISAEARMLVIDQRPASPEPPAANERPGAAGPEAPAPSNRTASNTPRTPRNATQAQRITPTTNTPTPTTTDRAIAAANRAVEAAMRGIQRDANFQNLVQGVGPHSAANTLREGRPLSEESIEAMGSINPHATQNNTLGRPTLLASNGQTPGTFHEGPLTRPEVPTDTVVTVERTIRRPPTTDIGSPPSDPSVPRNVMQQIVAVFRNNIGAVQNCYTIGLRNNPSLRGRLSVGFTVGTSGRIVGTPSVSGLSGGDNVHECIARRVRYYVFPTLTESVEVEFPVNVSPGG